MILSFIFFNLIITSIAMGVFFALTEGDFLLSTLWAFLWPVTLFLAFGYLFGASVKSTWDK